jgi:hypothetical protein
MTKQRVLPAVALMLSLVLLVAAWRVQADSISVELAANDPVPVVVYGSELQVERQPDVPELPFPDNPDPTQCGIPIRWGNEVPASLSGYYEGELVQPTVYLYDSHLRQSVSGAAPSGTQVHIVLYQQNPALDFYLVETVGVAPLQKGWVPAPFLVFEPLP